MKKSIRIIIFAIILLAVCFLSSRHEKFNQLVQSKLLHPEKPLPYQPCDINVPNHQLQTNITAYDFKVLEEDINAEAGGTDTAKCTKTYCFLAKHLVDNKETAGIWHLILTYQQVGYDYKLLHFSAYKQVKGQLEKIDII
ncbi:hypothetical protein [Pedobacter sp. L105]|uniref:hypothetical protein n=1 Tax=Pedobacter sp. L105 TaxID=1641871 RepID=UPI00131B4C84|nr:hypothetical protein [Pedobacter sp. L105]